MAGGGWGLPRLVEVGGVEVGGVEWAAALEAPDLGLWAQIVAIAVAVSAGTLLGARAVMATLGTRLVPLAYAGLVLTQLVVPALLLQRGVLGWLRPLPRIMLAGISWLGAWRVVELGMGTSPHVALQTGEASGSARGLPRSVTVYLLSVVEPVFDKAGRPVSARKGDLKRSFLYFAASLARFSVVVSVLKPRGYNVGGIPGHDATALEFFAISAVNIYAQVWMLYLFLLTALGLFGTILVAIGFVPIEVFNSPLSRSTSPRDFWGRRWNLLVHGLIKRTVFVPLRKLGVSGPSAALVGYFVSGIFHEYLFVVSMQNYVAGTMTAFFLCHMGFTVAETAALSSRAGKTVAARLPAPLCTALVTSLFLVTAPLFFDAMQELYGDLGTAGIRLVVKVMGSDGE